MKKRFLGLLTICSLALAGLVGCAVPGTSSQQPSTPSTPGSSETGSSEAGSSEASSSETIKTVKIEDTLEIKTVPPYELILEGQKVRIENVSVVAIHGTKVFMQRSDGEYVSDIHSLETQPKDPEAIKTLGQEKAVTVVGTVKTENGHTVLKDCVYEDGTEPHAGPYYWGNVTRSIYDQYYNRKMHGGMMKGVFQLVTAPTKYVGTEQSFKVVFPGEDTNLENLDNPFPINVTIPAGLSEGQADAVNHWIEGSETLAENPDFNPDKEVSETNQKWIYVPNKENAEGKLAKLPVAAGDAWDLLTMYTNIDGIGNLVLDASGTRNSDFAEIEGLHKNWDDAVAEVEENLYGADLLELLDLTAPAKITPYSYLVDTSRAGTQGVSFFHAEQPDVLILSMYSYEAKDLMDTIATQIDAWDEVESFPYPTLVMYDEMEDAYQILIGSETDPLMLLVLFNNDTYVQMYMQGVSVSVAGSSFEAALAAHVEWGNYFGLAPVPAPEATPAADASETEPAVFGTALPDLDAIIAAQKGKIIPAAFMADLILPSKGELMLDQLTVLFAAKDAKSVEDFNLAVIQAIIAAGYTEGRIVNPQIPGLGKTPVLYNAKTSEAIVLNPVENEAGEVVDATPFGIMQLPIQLPIPGVIAFMGAMMVISVNPALADVLLVVPAPIPQE